MAIFEDREKGFEQKFKHDQELEFKVRVRANKLLGLWVAGLLLAGTLPASAWATIQEATLIAAHRHHLVTLVALGENALRLALAIVVFFVGGGLTGLAAGILLGRLAGVTIGGLLLRRCRLETSLELQWAGLPAFARRLAPFAVILTSAMIYYRIDIIAVEALTDAQHTGLYGAALTLYSMALMIPESAMAAVYPRLSAAFQRTQAGYATASWQAAAALGLGLVPVALGLAWVAQSVVGTLYGPTFSAAAPTLTLLAATLPIHGINNALGQALLAGGRVSETVRLSCAGTAGHVILTFLLVSRLGNNGAPVAMLLSSTGIAVATFVLFRRHASSLTPGADRKRTSSNGALALVLGEA